LRRVRRSIFRTAIPSILPAAMSTRACLKRGRFAPGRHAEAMSLVTIQEPRVVLWAVDCVGGCGIALP
jgi:hypothetical protein